MNRVNPSAEQNSLDTREASRSRSSAIPIVALTDERTHASPDGLGSPPDVKSLAPVDGVEASAPEVAAIHPPPSAQAVAPDEVKSLIAADSPAAELTGVIVTPPIEVGDGRARRRLSMPQARMPRVHMPRMRPVHIPVRVHTFDSFRYRNYVLLWLTTALSSGGFWLQQVIVGWLAYEVTQSAFWTSLALGLDALPILFVGPVGGLLVDRFDRRKLLAAIYGYQAVVTTAFAAIALLGSLEAWHIFAFIFFMGLSWVISDPARMSLIPNMVPRESLINAFALNSMAFSMTRLAAPAIGGVLIVTVGAGQALILEGALQVGAVAAALGLRMAMTSRATLRPREVARDFAAGIRYVRGEPVLLVLFALTALPAMLVMPSIQGLMPVYAAEVFGVDARGLGLLLSAVGAGSTIGTFALASIGDIPGKGTAIVASVIVLALATLVFSVNGVFQAAYVNLMIVSAATMTFFSVSSAVVQSIVSDEFRGRVSGLYMITWGLFPIGSLVSGYLAERLGAPHATQIVSVALLLAFGIGAWTTRRFWRAL